jgi:hypothetical protein
MGSACRCSVVTVEQRHEQRGPQLALCAGNELGEHQREELIQENPPGQRLLDAFQQEDLRRAQQRGEVQTTVVVGEFHLVEQRRRLLHLIEDRLADGSGPSDGAHRGELLAILHRIQVVVGEIGVKPADRGGLPSLTRPGQQHQGAQVRGGQAPLDPSFYL